MEIIQNDENKLIVRMDNNESLINAIRRSINEVPSLAIDEVEIFKNDSALYDEFLAHRIGLVPIKTEDNTKAGTEVEFKLSKIGPGTVYSGDLKGAGKVVFSNIPLTILEKDQEVELIATARQGIGIDHDKFTPGLLYYRHLLLVKSKNSQIDKMVEHSKGLIKPERVKDGWICDLNEALAQDIESIDEKAIGDSEEILMIIESFGHMSAKNILLRALQALNENIGAFEKALK
jgi:DNA-directed RNA polymerase subunit D